MPVIIRPAVQSDIPYIYTICLKTGDNGKDASFLFDDPWIIGQFYAAPYLFFDITCCFIAEEKGIPKGYIVGTDQSPRFYHWLEKEWLPPLRLRYPNKIDDSKQIPEAEQNLIRTIHQSAEPSGDSDSPWKTLFPAHLHIDLLSDLQGKGCGRSLLELFFENLKNRNCPGVHLGVSAANTNAIGFYKKIGFTVLEEAPWGLIMGKAIH